MSEPDNGANYVRVILDALHSDPDRTGLLWRDEPVSAREFADSVTSVAHALKRLGGEQRKLVVALLTVTNTPGTLVLRYAANLVGAMVVHLQTANAVDPFDRIGTGTQADIIAATGATFLGVDEEHLPLAREVCGGMPSPPALVGLGPLGAGVVDLTAESGQDPSGLPDAEIRPDRPATVTYTSGSTGVPKGVTVSFGVRHSAVTGLAKDARTVYLSTLPLSHTSGAVADMAFVSGGTVVLQPTFDPVAALTAVVEHKITRMTVSPPQLYQLLNHAATGAYDLSSLKMLTYSGCPASPARLAEAVKVFGDVLWQTYGTTEVGPISELSPAEHHDPDLLSTAGRPTSAEVRIVDLNNRRELTAGETGEVCVRSPYAMLGYWGDPELTAQTVRGDWVRTGDLGWLDERGYLHLTGRMADMIKSQGIKVHPASVERVLTAHPDVVEAAVYGVADEHKVEHVHCAVVLREGALPDVDRLRRHVGSALTPNHAPVKFEFLTELPLNAMGKPDKRALRAAALRGR